jgi:ribosome biogenesis GTPase
VRRATLSVSTKENDVNSLDSYGWDDSFSQAFVEHEARGLSPARVVSEFKKMYRVVTALGEMMAEISGRVRHEANDGSSLPVVGDWVAIRTRPESDRATIHVVLPRRSSFSRRAPGTRVAPQVVAANLDLVFVVMGLDGDFNLRRLERYLTIAREGRISPVVVLNKADLTAEAAKRRDAVAAIASDVPVHVVSAETGAGLDELESHLLPGTTVGLLGSSGVGKSTLTNRLAGSSVQRTNAVRARDDRGRHTTSRRDLIVLPSRALLVDTPGMRELQLWSADEGLDQAFDDVRSLAATCRFSDCRHQGEPDCAVASAVEEGRLDSGRFRSFLALKREAEAIERKRDISARLAEKARCKAIHKSLRNHRKGW